MDHHIKLISNYCSVLPADLLITLNVAGSIDTPATAADSYDQNIRSGIHKLG